MKHLSILVPEGTAIIDTIIGSMNLFQMANSHRKRFMHGDPLFNIDLVAMKKEPITYNEFFTVTPTKTIEEVSKTDFIIVAGVVGNLDDQIDLNRPMIEWMKKQRIENGSEIASLCRGAFLLAETGLLNGKTCATHWITHDKFQKKYPEVELLPDKIISEDKGVYTSGGAYSFLNLLLYLIEKFYGRETAIWCSKMAEIEFDRLDQFQFAIFQGQKEHSDEAIKNIQQHIEDHLSENITVEELANLSAISHRNFIRRFKKATNNTPLEYIQRVRIEHAKKNLESSTKSINEVMYDSGYNDDKAFRNVFRKYSGLTPLEYRKKYNREMAMVG